MFYIYGKKKQSVKSTVRKAAVLSAAGLFSLFFPVLRALPAAAAAYDAEDVSVPIIMYHSVLNHPPQAGDYVVSTKTFKEDMAYLKRNGYSAVFVAELIAYVYDGTPLPEKPVVITLDDGFLNNLTYVLPILEETGMKATISVVGSYTERFSKTGDPNINYAYLTWADIKALQASGHIEIGNHSYDLHDQDLGALKKSGETVRAYQERLMADIGKLQSELEANTGILPKVFAYPFGLVSEEAPAALKALGFKAALNCYEKVNRIGADPEALYRLGRFNRSGRLSTEAFMNRLFG
ncbi:MAG: polysaccharide deacetylase family protein [Oscillospiraceae bacterium]|nr:polysaccharide deacetylase family protein [Oscillospiraceae bacterium]